MSVETADQTEEEPGKPEGEGGEIAGSFPEVK